MSTVNDNLSCNCDFSDIPVWLRVVLAALVVLAILSTSGCSAPMPVVQVERHPPAAAMVRPDPLPRQTDPSLGGLFKGYASAAQRYRGCVDRLMELQDWVDAGYVKR
jgi:hypothetical protein